jgi:electron transfer flavoprotein alpha subunit
MSTNILFLAHVDESGANLPKATYDALGAAMEATAQLGATLTIGLIGEDIQPAAQNFAGTGAKIYGVQGADFAQPRYASDAAAAEAICRAAFAQIIIAPHTSRFARVLPGVAQRLKGSVDTHVTALEISNGALTAKRWFYRQRIEASLQRDARPWILLLDAGCHQPWCAGGAAQPDLHLLELALPLEATRTKFVGIRTPSTGAQTIRPDADLLFVAGAGWTKKQSDGKTHGAEAESLILGFLEKSGASLGGSKSLVDQSGENQEVLHFMTHLNQVGQTGSTPRHPKGLSTCCHGEEPHVVGWRFISERRAINLDPNCGWARGKADILYVGDAFQVLAKLNALLEAKQQARDKEPAPTTA